MSEAKTRDLAPLLNDNAATATSTVAKVTRAARRVGGAVRSAFFSSTAIFSSSKSYYEAANTNNPRIPKAINNGPNGALGEIESIRARSRQMVVNDSLYQQSVNQVANNVIHRGIRPICPYPDLAELWEDWNEEADSRGQLSFYGLQYQAGWNVPLSGEVFFRMRTRRDGDMESGVPLQLQMLEADHCPLTKTERAANGNYIVAGVERDYIDRPVAYHLYPVHPLDYTSKLGSLTPDRVPAEDVLHLYMPKRPGDTRGAPWAAAALNTFENLRMYDVAELERKKGAANFGGFYKKPMGEDESLPGEVEYEDDIVFQPLEPNTFVELPEGYDVELSQPPSGDNNYPNYRREQIASAAAALGLAYEHITLNFEKVSDRQYRALMLEVGRMIESVQQHIFIHQLCKPVWRRFVSAAILAGVWTPPKGAKPRDYMRVSWMVPARGHIHPVQDIEAVSKAIEAGLLSRKRGAALAGYIIEELDLENARDKSRSEGMGLRYSVYGESDAVPGDDTAAKTPAEDRIDAITTSDIDETLDRVEQAETA